MTIKWIGAILTVCGCGGFGFSLAIAHRRRERMLEQIIKVIAVMDCELQYRLTQLPDLCTLAADEASDCIRKCLLRLSQELNRRISPDVWSCMCFVVDELQIPYKDVRAILLELGRSLGRYDLDGQIKGLNYVRTQCELCLKDINTNRTERIRCYQTLGLCAGTALVILLL